jgi:hypothetical protein
LFSMKDALTRDEADALDPHARRIEQGACVLKQLGEIGLEMARAVRDQVAARAETPFRDPALAFSRIARAIRLTVALEARLAKGDLRERPWDRELPPGARPEDRDAGETPAFPEEDTPDPAVPETDRPERPESERERERLHDRQEYAEAALLRRPAAEIYAQVCKDLGQSPEPGLFEPCNDDEAAPEPAPPRRVAAGFGRSALLHSAAPGPLAGQAPILGPFPRAPP